VCGDVGRAVTPSSNISILSRRLLRELTSEQAMQAIEFLRTLGHAKATVRDKYGLHPDW
jgi:hypothetical protein